MKIAVVPNLNRSLARSVTHRILVQLHALGQEVFMDEVYRKESFEADVFWENHAGLMNACDLILAVGGDGTIIHQARHAAEERKPILGINTGHLGFVAGLEASEISLLSKLVEGDYKLENRMMLRASYEKEGKQHYMDALNDIVIYRGPKILDFEVSLSDREMSSYRADGLICATPTGSTAYSLAAGGPVIDPEMRCILLTPVCSHSLLTRPVLFSEHACLQVKVSSAVNSGAQLTADGDDPIQLEEGQSITVTKSPLSVRLINLKRSNFYEVVNAKLGERRN
jgi:NAD+ kinase